MANIMTTQEILKQCAIEGSIVKLPQIKLDRKTYQDVAKQLEHIGGKWKGGKVFGFVFEQDPTSLISEIANGKTRNLKKEFQFFETPEELAIELCEHAFIDAAIVGKVLEPSAGKGAIIKAIHKDQYDQLNVRYCELDPLNRSFLSRISNTKYLCDDFLQLNAPDEFATIIANPPFTKNQDIDHIYKMYECLKPSGRLVSVASKHYQFTSGKKETSFREWLSAKDAHVINLPAGVFKTSGTGVSACIIIINKHN